MTPSISSEHRPDLIEQIRQRHDEDQERSPEYCDRWRDTDRVNVSFQEAHQDRATLLAYIRKLEAVVEAARDVRPTCGHADTVIAALLELDQHKKEMSGCGG